MRVLARAALVPALAVVCVATTFGGVASGATSWIVVLHAASAGEGRAQALPATPTSVAASCPAPTTSKTIKVAWNAVTHATSYSIYDSTTSATGTYTLVTSVTTTSWTSGILATGNYWYEVTASIGTNWASAKSSASGESTINSFSPFCVQP
jgi:fibronectin type 3 domain-containing protein